MPPTPKPPDPRNTRAYRRNAATILANSDICWLCGHAGARTVDHVTRIRDWPPDLPGVNDLANLRPAHGAGPRISNPCPTCRRMCNQEREHHNITPQRRSRIW